MSFYHISIFRYIDISKLQAKTASMAKKQPSSFPSTERQKIKKRLSHTLERLQNAHDLVAFLFHALSESEQIMLARRIQIALQLMKGLSQQKIAEQLHVGLTTVQTVDRWLNSWQDYRTQMPLLYRTMMQRKQQRSRGIDDFPESFRSLRRRYPLHFLFFTLLLDGEG